MMPTPNDVAWMNANAENDDDDDSKNNDMASLCAFKSILDVDDDWYNNVNTIQNHTHMSFPPDSLLLNPIDSSSSCSPSPSVFTNLPYFLPPPPPLDNHGFDMPFLGPQASNSNFADFTPNLCSDPKILKPLENFEEASGKSVFLNRSKILRPLESLPPSGATPTLFQKRVAHRRKLTNEVERDGSNSQISEKNKKRKMGKLEDVVENASFDGSGLNYDDSDYELNENVKNGGNSSNANSTTVSDYGGGGGDKKGKKKGMPAKNLMAERRRRKKLNDRLYMLRSVVPKISKMDRASILGDAIEYLKELLQRINDLHNELESSTPAGSSLTPSSSFHPLTPTPPSLPCRIKDELCPTSLPSPNGHPTRVEVRLREGRAVNIHMFCSRKPGLLLSSLRALDNLGLDIQQAVISCFNGFAMDIFRAEQCKEGQDVHPEQIKAVLLDSAGFHGLI